MLLCTIWLMAKGAAFWSGWSRSHAASVSVISASHSSSCEAGRAFSLPIAVDLYASYTALSATFVAGGFPRHFA